MITRRGLVGSLAVGAGGLLLSGCNRINADPAVRSLLQSAEGLTMRAQRIIGDRTDLAREFTAADLSGQRLRAAVSDVRALGKPGEIELVSYIYRPGNPLTVAV